MGQTFGVVKTLWVKIFGWSKSLGGSIFFVGSKFGGIKIWNFAMVTPPDGQIWNYAMVALPGDQIWNYATVAPPGGQI